MRTLRILILASIGLAALLPAHAQRIAPGLWEIQMSMASDDGRLQAQMAQMQKQLAQMPPEQRKMMEEMMKSQGVGVDISKGLQATRVCISKEQAERDELPTKQDGRCSHEPMQRSGSTMRMRFTCTDPASRGEVEIKLQGDKAYTARMTTDTTDRKGQSRRVEMNQQARWLGADCGTLQPPPGR
ncbi:MAG: hypothetical protein AMXMBFR78_31740 [Rubrivivax sp.]